MDEEEIEMDATDQSGDGKYGSDEEDYASYKTETERNSDYPSGDGPEFLDFDQKNYNHDPNNDDEDFSKNSANSENSEKTENPVKKEKQPEQKPNTKKPKSPVNDFYDTDTQNSPADYLPDYPTKHLTPPSIMTKSYKFNLPLGSNEVWQCALAHTNFESRKSKLEREIRNGIDHSRIKIYGLTVGKPTLAHKNQSCSTNIGIIIGEDAEVTQQILRDVGCSFAELFFENNEDRIIATEIRSDRFARSKHDVDYREVFVEMKKGQITWLRI